MPSSHPVHAQIRAIGPRVLHLKKGRGRPRSMVMTKSSITESTPVQTPVAQRFPSIGGSVKMLCKYYAGVSRLWRDFMSVGAPLRSG
jgi:hypothetical protein